jgi:hypothetical protein
MHSQRNNPGPPATQQRHRTPLDGSSSHAPVRAAPADDSLTPGVRQRAPTCCTVVLSSELIDGGSFDDSCMRINEMLMLAKVDKFEPERLA